MSDDTATLLSLTGPDGTTLVPTRLDARETISELFQFEIDATAREVIAPASVLNKPACLAINHGGETTRYFHGIVGEFGAIGRSGLEDTLYRMVLVPQLAQTDLQIDCRMFLKKTAQEIIKTILDEAGVTDIAFRVDLAPKQRDATAQYNETSLHFITRLMEEEGWFYFFEHSAAKHTLVVANHNSAFQTIDGATLQFGDGSEADHLTSFREPQALTHGKISLRDYDPSVPTKNLKADKNTVLKHGNAAGRAVFHWPALTRETSQVTDRAKWRMEAAEAAVSLVSAEGAMASLYAGGRFRLNGADNAQTQYVIQSIRHMAEDDDRHSAGGRENYANNFSAFANAVPWRQPMSTERPRMEGLHTAIVLGPSGDDIHTDDEGRIKIRFPWDWRGDATADTAAWARVVQPWAGNKWGGQFIPRVGTEVAVAFMDGDPDRPIVVGGFYNGDDKPIFPAAEKTKTGFRSRSVNKGGTEDFNEFSFDDKKGSELVFLHAQKDMTTEVENDQVLKVDNDRTITVKGKETVTIKGNRTHEISEGNESLTVTKGNQTTDVKAGNFTMTVNQGNHATDVKLGNVTVKAGVGSITLQATQSITLKVGANTLTLSQSGIEMKGMQISIAGQTQTELKGLMTKVDGTAMLTLKGGITMIN